MERRGVVKAFPERVMAALRLRSLLCALMLTAGCSGDASCAGDSDADLDWFSVAEVGSQTAGVPFTITVTAYDTLGNVATEYEGMPTISTSSGNTGGCDGTCDPVVSLDPFHEGVSTIHVTAFKAATAVTVTVADGPATAATNSFRVAPAQEVDRITVSPPTARVRVGDAQPFIVEAWDRFANLIGDVTETATLEIQPDGACGAAACTAAAGGTHTVTARVADLTVKAELLASTADVPTSDELIDVAVTEGRIDSKTGLVYKTLAAFRDRRLPAEFAGAAGVDTEDALRALQDSYADLPEPLRELAYPFLIPPLYEESWSFLPSIAEDDELRSPQAGGPAPLDAPATVCADDVTYTLSSRWAPVTGSLLDGVAFTVWYDVRRDASGSESALAEKVLIAALNTVQTMTAADMKPPKADSGPSPCHGTDRSIDVLIDDKADSFELPHVPRVPRFGRSGFVVLRRGDLLKAFNGKPMLRGVVAHEVTHLMQDAYADISYGPFSESMAKWAESYVFPSDDTERGNGTSGGSLIHSSAETSPDVAAPALPREARRRRGSRHRCLEWQGYHEFARIARPPNDPPRLRTRQRVAPLRDRLLERS